MVDFNPLKDRSRIKENSPNVGKFVKARKKWTPGTLICQFKKAARRAFGHGVVRT